MIRQMLRALRQQHRRFGMIDDGDQHRGGTNGADLGEFSATPDRHRDRRAPASPTRR